MGHEVPLKSKILYLFQMLIPWNVLLKNLRFIQGIYFNTIFLHNLYLKDYVSLYL